MAVKYLISKVQDLNWVFKGCASAVSCYYPWTYVNIISVSTKLFAMHNESLTHMKGCHIFRFCLKHRL